MNNTPSSFQLLFKAALQFKNYERTKHEGLIQQLAVKHSKENEKANLAGSVINDVVKALGLVWKPAKPFTIPIKLITGGIKWAVENGNSGEPDKAIIRIINETNPDNQ